MRLLLTGITFILLINVSTAETLEEKYANLLSEEVSLDQKKESIFNFLKKIS